MADSNNIPNVEMLKEGQPVKFSERYRGVIKTLLPFFDQKGWLDFETA
jgi:hypothetical protein